MTSDGPRPNQNGLGSNDSELTARRREEIVLAACAVFDEVGYANTRIADISTRVGIGQGTIYRYFTGKDDLMSHLITHGVRRVLVAMREDEAVAAGTTRTREQFTAQIITVARRLLDISAAEPQLVRVLLNQAPAALPDTINELTDQLSDATAAYLRAGINGGYLRPDMNARVVADAMTGSVMPAMRKAARGQLEPDARIAAADTIGAFIAGGVLLA